MFKKNKNKIIIFLIVILVIFLVITQTKTFLNHKYLVETFGNIEKTDKDTVILFHGIYGKNTDMSYIAKKLEKEKYFGINIQYPTTDDKIEKMTDKYIEPEIRKITEKVEKINEKRRQKNQKELKINFVVHSMGSVILRHYLKENEVKNLGKVVFISPPTHGTQLSDMILTRWLKDILGPAVEQLKTDKDSFVNSLGNPNYPCYVMVGSKTNNPVYSMVIKGKDDGMVPINTVIMENCKFKMIQNTTHTSILKTEETLDEIIKFFENKE